LIRVRHPSARFESLSGCGLPFAIVLIRRDLDEWEPGEHDGTFRGNNHAFVTATAAVEHYWQTANFTRELRTKVDGIGHLLRELVKHFSPHLFGVRGRGMMLGVRSIPILRKTN